MTAPPTGAAVADPVRRRRADAAARRRRLAGDLDTLRAALAALGDVVVAFSGGADSAFLARVATDTLGPDRVLCVTAVSPSLAPEELADCRALAAEWGLRYREVATDELADPAYRANDGSRCYHCKASLMEALGPVAGAAGPGATVVLGVNLDDLSDHRPGQAAAAERGAVFPLVTAGFTKADVREWSRRLGLRTWDKPAAACLASRVPYGTPVTFTHARLGGPGGVRAARRWGSASSGCATTATPPGSRSPRPTWPRWWPAGTRSATAVHGAGYRYVTLDLDGFRSGNLNDALGGTGAATTHRRRRP